MCLFYLRNSLKLTLTTSHLGFHCPTLVGLWRFSILVEQTLEFRRVVCPRYFFAPDCSYLNLLLPLEAQLTAMADKIILASFQFLPPTSFYHERRNTFKKQLGLNPRPLALQ